MLVSVMEGHRLWAPVYDTNPNPVLALEKRIIPRFLGPIRCRRFVDVACGTGRWMTYLRQRRGVVFGADLCVEMLRQAHAKTDIQGTLVLADAARLPFRNGLADASLCSFAVGYLPDLNKVFSELARVTKKRGTVILSDLHPDALSNGWRRSFRLGSAEYEMRHFAPTVEQLLRAAQHAELKLQRKVDAYFGRPERELFRRAGKEPQFAQLRAIPAVWIGIWTNV